MNEMIFSTLFKKKTPSVKITDRVWMNASGKWSGIIQQHNIDPETIFIYWFDDTRKQLHDNLAALNKSAMLMNYRQVTAASVRRHQVIFVEHYPLAPKEMALYKELQLLEAIIFSSLQEPLLQLFGGDRIRSIMKTMGMEENESMEHPYISQSIQRAQEKIERKLIVEHSANNQQDWLDRNIIGEL